MRHSLLISQIRQTKSTDTEAVKRLASLVGDFGDVFGPVECTWSEEFQEWDFSNGQRVPNGHPIGFDIKIDGQFQTVNFEDIRMSDMPWDDEELKIK